MADDHTRAPVLEALVEYRRTRQPSFTPPGHKQARGADPAVREILGDAVFLGDVLARAVWTTGSPVDGCWNGPRN